MAKENFNTAVSDHLPPLAWIVTMSGGSASIEVGRGVEICVANGVQYAFEGAWDGQFEACGFAKAENFFGSGVSFADGRITFSTATHTLDCLYVFFAPEQVLVSNSLAFLYQRAGLKMQPGSGISSRVLSIIKGLRVADKVLHEDANGRLERLAVCNFEIRDGAVQSKIKAQAPNFDSFETYHAYLGDRFAQILANAADPMRKRRYEPLTTISTGYDSTVCAVLTANKGGKYAVTIGSERYGASDSGASIAEILGLSCTVLPRHQVQDSPDLPQAEFVASGCGGDAVMANLAPHFRGAIVTTGYHGGRMWDIHHTPTDDMVRGDPSGSGLTEFRLREDFIHAPLPFIAAPRQEDLLQIARSDEMAPYRLGGSYDRPVPRRIVEEAGVPRAAFGQHKRAILFMLSSQERLLAPTFRRTINRLLRERLGTARFLVVKLHAAPRVLLSGLWKVCVRGAKTRAGKALSLGVVRLDQRYERAFPFTMFNDALFITAVEKTAERYDVTEGKKDGA